MVWNNNMEYRDMDFLHFFDDHNQPLLRTILVILTVANAIVLAFLIFIARSPEAANTEAISSSYTLE